jgi:hypothetical protein
MDKHSRIYVELTPDLKEQLGHRFSLQEVLSEAGIDAEIEWAAIPPEDPEQRTKALVEAVTVASIGQGFEGIPSARWVFWLINSCFAWPTSVRPRDESGADRGSVILDYQGFFP